MTEASRTILERFQVRKSKGQKAEFRAWLCDTLTKAGYTPLVETALAMPEEDWDKVCFVFFDNEEKGLFGSSFFAKAHPQMKREKLLINFDCVSDGDYIQFFPPRP